MYEEYDAHTGRKRTANMSPQFLTHKHTSDDTSPSVCLSVCLSLSLSLSVSFRMFARISNDCSIFVNDLPIAPGIVYAGRKRRRGDDKEEDDDDDEEEEEE